MSSPAGLLSVLKEHVAQLPSPPPPEEVVPLLGLLKHIQYLSSQALLSQSIATAEVRTDVDRQGLEESGLNYEKKRLESEIASCEAFESVYQTLPLDLPPPTEENDERILTALRDELASLKELRIEKNAIAKDVEQAKKEIKDGQAKLAGQDVALGDYAKFGNTIFNSKMQ